MEICKLILKMELLRTTHQPLFMPTTDDSNISSRFSLSGKTISFSLGNYDHAKTLVIDPWVFSPAFLEIIKHTTFNTTVAEIFIVTVDQILINCKNTLRSVRRSGLTIQVQPDITAILQLTLEEMHFVFMGLGAINV